MDIKLLDSHLRLTSEQSEFISFIVQFTGLQTNAIKERDPDIYVNLKLNKHFQIHKNYRQISRNIWLRDSAVYISEIERFPGLKLEARIEQNRFHIDAFLTNTNQPLLKRILLHMKFTKYDNHLLLTGLLYYIIFIPFYYYIERFRSQFLLHASAIKCDEKGVVLSGLGGIGKSTFSLGTLLFKECRFLSDNLIFYDCKKIYSCPEPIALDTRSIDILEDVTELLVPKQFGFTHGRGWYQIKQESISFEAIPKYLFWLQRGDKNKISPIDKKTCIRELLNMNLLAKEIREYYILAAAFDLAFSCSLPPSAYFERLSHLLSDVDCYILQFKAGDDIKTVFNETISKIII